MSTTEIHSQSGRRLLARLVYAGERSGRGLIHDEAQPLLAFYDREAQDRGEIAYDPCYGLYITLLRLETLDALADEPGLGLTGDDDWQLSRAGLLELLEWVWLQTAFKPPRLGRLSPLAR